MNIIDSAYQTVHDYPGGSESLAPRIGMSPAVLRNKVNPNNSTHHLSLAEANSIMGVTGDDRLLHALAAEHGYTLQRTDAPESGSVICAFLEVAAQKGDLSELIRDTLADQRVSPNELAAIERVCAAMQAATAALAAAARAAVMPAPSC